MFVLKKTHEARVARILAIQAEERTKWRKEMQAERETVGRLIKDKGRLLHEATVISGRLGLADDRDNSALVALTAIAAQATPGANATVKRMARIAQDAIDARFAAINGVIAALESDVQAAA